MYDGIELGVVYRNGSVVLSNRRLMTLEQANNLGDELTGILGDIIMHLWTQIETQMQLEPINA